MFAAFLIGFAVVFFVFGLTEFLRMFWLYLLRPKGDPPRVLTVFLKSGICMQQLRHASEFIKWEGFRTFWGVLALDCGLSEAERHLVQRYANESSFVLFGEQALERLPGDYGANKTKS